MPRLQALLLLGCFVGGACARQTAASPDSLPARSTPAVTEAIALHGSALAPHAGVWVAEDSQGRLLASGVLAPMPTTVSSDNLYGVFARRPGERIVQFGFAQSRADRRPANVPVLYAVYAPAP